MKNPCNPLTEKGLQGSSWVQAVMAVRSSLVEAAATEDYYKTLKNKYKNFNFLWGAPKVAPGLRLLQRFGSNRASRGAKVRLVDRIDI